MRVLRCQFVRSQLGETFHFSVLGHIFAPHTEYYLGEHRHHRGRHEAKAAHNILHRLLLIADFPRLPAQLDGEQEAGGGDDREDVETGLVLQRQVVEKPVLRPPCGDVRVVPEIFKQKEEMKFSVRTLRCQESGVRSQLSV